MKTVLCVLCALTSSLCATMHYSISAIEGNRVTFSNNATFIIDSQHFPLLQSWEVDAVIELVFPSDRFNLFPVSDIVNGHLRLLPAFTLLDQGGRAVQGWLELAPTAEGVDTFSVVMVVPDQRAIILQKLGMSSLWMYPERDAFSASLWHFGDFVMAGGNEMSPFSSYDAVLFNTTQQSVVHAFQP